MSNIVEALGAAVESETNRRAAEVLGAFVQVDQYVGEVFSIGYETANVQIHDFYRREAGGIPSLCFLVASRVQPGATLLDPDDEDSSIILLRVLDSAQLPNSSEAERIRVETAQRVTGDSERHWDDPSVMDAQTAQYLSYAGVSCRVLGTFFLAREGNDVELRFGSDLSNYYPNRGLKVYKPTSSSLEKIVNYQAVSATAASTATAVPIGNVRYASSSRIHQGVDSVPVSVPAEDLLGQRTALFGMTRTGKSNTVKIIAQSTVELSRQHPEESAAGQIIFDINGEYANLNPQDDGTALFDAYRDITTRYSILEKEDFRVLRLNFFEALEAGFGMISTFLDADTSDYVQSFQSINLVTPDPEDRGAVTRWERLSAAYKACLQKAGFIPGSHRVKFVGQEDLNELSKIDPSKGITVEDAARWFEAVWSNYRTSAYILAYPDKNNGREWANEDLKATLVMLTGKDAGADNARRSGTAKLRPFAKYHAATTGGSFEDDIISELRRGHLVIIDLSQGDPILQAVYSDLICRAIFRDAMSKFVDNISANVIQIFFEEAHNLFPRQSDSDLLSVYNRIAKEGAKLNLGLIYSTQEVSSISSNILKNTQNWFIGHLNNTDETRELIKYYDFADFEKSIRRAQDRGFLRVKTLSHPFTIPVQIARFSANT